MVSVELVRAELKDAELIHSMKYESFLPLYERYRDDATSPVSEPLSKVVRQLQEERTDYWLIRHDGEAVGAVRVVSDGMENGRSMYRVSPLFILPAHQNRGFGYAAMVALFGIYPQADVWRLSTIKQEKGNCHLYEKCGFAVSAPEKVINECMTLVFYQKENPHALA